ncbi:hypothetical protein VTL71DRAFT_15852 [Oculimacula yallundae]|uniref:Uncharacterized protein n=1 Tax=Oculimacula yallundae TaxID=86028 RepID=A0ABR4CEW9_9HELO
MASNQNGNSSSNQASGSCSATSSNPASKSNYEWLQDSGHDNMDKFLLSYGLKMHNDEDVEEGKAILKGLRDGEQKEWEEQTASKK